MKKIYEKELGRWIIALLSTLILFGVIALISPKVFFINDDENIMYTLAGYYTDGIPFDHSFLNYVLAGFLRLLYTFAPSVPWYGIFHVSVLFSSVAIIEKTILKEGYYRNFTWYTSLVIGISFFLMFLTYPTILMQFTTTSAFAGTAAVVLVLDKKYEKDSKTELILDDVLSVLFLLLCFMHRKNTGYVILCFYGGTVLYQFIKILFLRSKKERLSKNIWKFILQLFISIVALLCVISIDSVKRNTDGWQYFYAYDNARFKMTDYPHDSFEENPELYSSIGWNEELYELAGKSWWFFMDDKINADSFKKISQTGYYSSTPTTFSEIISSAKGLFMSDRIAQIAFIGSIVIIIFLIIIFIRDRRKKAHIWDYLYACGIAFGSFILCFYLCYRQRFPLRAYHTIVIPFLAIMIIVIVRLMELRNIKKSGSICKCAIIISIAVIIGSYSIAISKKQAVDRIDKSNRTLQIEQYAMKNPENFYIYDTSLTFRYLPFTTYVGMYPSNLMFWGGMGWNSPAFFKQLELNGLGYLYSDILLNDNTYYISWDDYQVNGKTMKDRLTSYMEVTFPGIKITLVDTLDNNINIYKFSY